MVVQEQHQLEVIRVLGKMLIHLGLQRRVALDAMTGMDFLKQDVAIGKVEHAIQRAHIVSLQLILRERPRFLSEELVKAFRRLEVQLSRQLRADAEKRRCRC